MKQKSDYSKIVNDKRCFYSGSDYVGFIKANEAHSLGTASQLYDPIAGRTVDTLSMGENEFFWTLRNDDTVDQIQEQLLLVPSRIEQICKENNFNIPKNILTTDFYVIYKDGRSKAFSIKNSKKEFNKDSYKTDTQKRQLEKLLKRQLIEKLYWESFGIEFEIIFREDIDKIYAGNIRTIMQYYDGLFVLIDEPETILKYLLAHKLYSLDLAKPISFIQVANENQFFLQETWRKLLCQKI